jgi:glycosyltransferase involved in cell wall biosynthesis
MLPAAESHMIEHGMAPEKFVHIPNGIDAAEWQNAHAVLPPEHAGLLAGFRKEKRFILCYAGAHGIANALSSLLEAAGMLEDLPLAIVLVGQGPEKAALHSKAVQMGLNNVAFLPPVPKAAIPALLAAADALFIGLQDQPLFRFGVSPNKLMDYMMASKPVISAIRAGNDMVSESGCGITVAPEQPAELVKAIETIMNMTPDQRDALGRNGRAYVLKHHEYRVLATQFETAMPGK